MAHKVIIRNYVVTNMFKLYSGALGCQVLRICLLKIRSIFNLRILVCSSLNYFIDV